MTLLLVDAHGNPLGSTIAVSPVASDGVTVFCVSDLDRSPVPVLWTLQNSNLVKINNPGPTGTQVSALGGPSYFGALVGFTSSKFVQSMQVGPQTSVVYVPPPTGLYIKPVQAILIASTGAETVALQIRVDNLSLGNFN